MLRFRLQAQISYSFNFFGRISFLISMVEPLCNQFVYQKEIENFQKKNCFSLGFEIFLTVLCLAREKNNVKEYKLKDFFFAL